MHHLQEHDDRDGDLPHVDSENNLHWFTQKIGAALSLVKVQQHVLQ
jgi:hypothetical protein